MIDVERLRADTPGCDNVIHFNHAGASLPPARVTEAVIDHLGLEEDIGGYEAADANAALVEHTYDAVASLIGGHRDEIALVENATRAWDMAFYSLELGDGDRILTGQSEYASNAIAFLHQAKRRRVEIDVVPDDEYGQLDVTELARRIDDRTKLIAVNHVPSQNGLVNPAAEIGAVARDAGVTFLLDACQSAGQLPIDVEAIGCDLLSSTGRKFLRAPRGTGFLWVRRDLIEKLDPPFLDMRAADLTSATTYDVRADARRFETWESFVAGRIGLGVAVDLALEIGLDEIAARNAATAEALRARLGAIDGVQLHDRGKQRCAIVMFSVDGHDAEEVAATLRAQRINVSVAVRSDASLDPTWGPERSRVRASVHYLTIDEELDQFAAAVAAIARA